MPWLQLVVLLIIFEVKEVINQENLDFSLHISKIIFFLNQQLPLILIFFSSSFHYYNTIDILYIEVTSNKMLIFLQRVSSLELLTC